MEAVELKPRTLFYVINLLTLVTWINISYVVYMFGQFIANNMLHIGQSNSHKHITLLLDHK